MFSQCSRRKGEIFSNLLKMLWFSNTTCKQNGVSHWSSLLYHTYKMLIYGDLCCSYHYFFWFFTFNRKTDNILSNFICKSYVIFLIILICINIFPQKSVIFLKNLKIKHIKIRKSVPIFFNKTCEYMCCFIFIHFIIPSFNSLFPNDALTGSVIVFRIPNDTRVT